MHRSLTKKLKRFVEEGKEFVTVAVIDRDAKKMSFLYERRSRARCAYVQHVRYTVLLDSCKHIYQQVG